MYLESKETRALNKTTSQTNDVNITDDIFRCWQKMIAFENTFDCLESNALLSETSKNIANRLLNVIMIGDAFVDIVQQ
jgi:phosphopantothenate synthetase